MKVLRNKREKKYLDTKEIQLIDYYDDFNMTLSWYQDHILCKQVDNIDYVYDLDRLIRMYRYLCENGKCFYIKFGKSIVGDITLLDNNELAIVVAKEYQNKKIGRRALEKMIDIAKTDGRKFLKAEIYSFNKQSQRMFESLGFIKKEKDIYFLNLD